MTTVLVTGAAGDIGTAIAEVLARRAHRLALADHPDVSEPLGELSRRLDAESVTFDVTNEPPSSGWARSAGS